MSNRTLALALALAALPACDLDPPAGPRVDEQDSSDPTAPGEDNGEWGEGGCGVEPEEIDPPSAPYPHDPGVAAEGAILDCDVDAGYQVDTWQSAAAPEVALILGAVYETRGDHDFDHHPVGAGAVHFDRPGASVLALSAYEPTHWTITVGEAADLQKVILIGYEDQTADVPEGVELEVWHGSHSACGYSLPYNGEGCHTDLLIASLEQHTGLPLHRFDGCYHATTFAYAG